jgi:mannose/fructose/N-acetylgalactosamine-specific phosphotransferase system component IIB
MSTQAEVKQKIVGLDKTYKDERRRLIEEYNRLSPIQVGDKVKVTQVNGTVEFGQCVELRYDDCAVINKLKKDGTVSNNGRIYGWHGATIEKI